MKQMGSNPAPSAIVYCDVTKAFDKVDYFTKLITVHKTSTGGNLLAWFKDDLSNTRQRVSNKGTVL